GMPACTDTDAERTLVGNDEEMSELMINPLVADGTENAGTTSRATVSDDGYSDFPSTGTFGIFVSKHTGSLPQSASDMEKYELYSHNIHCGWSGSSLVFSYSSLFTGGYFSRLYITRPPGSTDTADVFAYAPYASSASDMTNMSVSRGTDFMWALENAD